jgi:hypothetical protein
MGLGDLLLWAFRAARRADRRRAARNRRAAATEQRVAVGTQRAMVTAQRKLESNDRMLQARMEKLVRTRHRDAAILERRAGLPADPKKHIRTSGEISAEATALIKESLGHLEELSGDGRGRRQGESMAAWLGRLND